MPAEQLLIEATNDTNVAVNKIQLQTILNHVDKQKGFVYGAIRFNEKRTAILVELKPHKRSRPICSGRGRKGPGYDRTQVREFQFVPLWLIRATMAMNGFRVRVPPLRD